MCGLPCSSAFAPVGAAFVRENAVVMTVEEYETVRLIDYKGLTQEECAGYMEIARTTVQHIYCEARKKLSAALVEGKALVIDGGEYWIDSGNGPGCGRGGCRRRGRGNGFPEE